MEFSISSFLDILGIKSRSQYNLLGAAIGVGASTIAATYLGLGVIPYLILSSALAGAGAYWGEEIYIALENKRLGISPPKITIQRKENIKVTNELQKEEERNVFTLSNIKIIDAELIRHATEQIIQHSDEGSDPPVYNFKNKPTYSVEIITKPGTTLGELEYTNWENNPDYSVKVIDENGHPVTDPKITQDVLTTLEFMPKFLGTTYINPHIPADQAIVPSSSGFFGRTTGWFKRNILGQTNLLEADPTSPCNPSLTSDTYFDNLVDFSIKTGKAEILKHYRDTLIQTNKRSSELKIEKLTTEGVLRGKEPSRVATAALVATAAVAGGASLLFMTGLNTVLGVSIGAAATLAVSTLGIGLPIIFAAIAAVALIAAIYRGIKHYKKYKLSQEIKNTKSQTLRLEKKLKEKFTDLKPTNTAIQQCYQTKSSLLDMKGKQMGDVCTTIISKWINSIQGKNCTEINLANNNITADGAKKLAQALENSQIKSINLKKNPLLTQEGLVAIKDALLKNFTITSFQYDYDKSFFSHSTSRQLDKEVTKQLLINAYIQGDNIAQEMLKKHFGSTEITPLELAAIEKIKQADTLTCLQKIEIDKITNNKIKQALLERQITFTLQAAPNKHLASQQLENYISIYNHFNEDTFKIIAQKNVLSLLKTSLFTKTKNDLYITVPASLKNMQHSAKTDLLRRCILQTHTKPKDASKHAVGIAVLLSALLTENFLSSNNPKIQECIKQINTWDTTKSHWSLAQYITNLQAAKSQLSSTEQERIDTIIQTAITKDLHTRFTCLQDKDNTEDFAQLQNELKTNVLFQKFVIAQETNINPEVATYVDNITKRNQLCALLESPASLQPSTITNTFAEFLATYKTMDPQYLTTPPIDGEKLNNLITNDIADGTNVFCTQMRTFSSTNQLHLQNLLALCFKDEQDGKDKAALITDLLGTAEVFNDTTGQINPPYKDSLLNSFAWPRGLLGKIVTFSRKTGTLTYSAVKNLLAGERIRALKAGNYEEFKILENLLQHAYQKELLKNHQNLTFASDSDFVELKQQLDHNFDLRDSTIIEKGQVSPEVLDYIKTICFRNIMLDITAQYKRDKRISSQDLEDFITTAGNLTKNIDSILAQIQPLDILNIIKNDMGQSTQLSCVNLKKLQQENPNVLTALLTRCFTYNDSVDDASKKAFLVSSMLQFDALYQPNQQNNQLCKDITYQLYYAITTWGIISTGNYQFSQIEKKLDAIKQNLERDKQLVQQGKQAKYYPDIDAKLRTEALATLSSTLSQTAKITAETPIKSQNDIMRKLGTTETLNIEEKPTKSGKLKPLNKPLPTPSEEETYQRPQIR